MCHRECLADDYIGQQLLWLVVRQAEEGKKCGEMQDILAFRVCWDVDGDFDGDLLLPLVQSAVAMIRDAGPSEREVFDFPEAPCQRSIRILCWPYLATRFPDSYLCDICLIT